jgi:ABC-type transporter Mla subunit MlaD
MTNDELQQLDQLIQKRLKEAVDPLNKRLDDQQEQIISFAKKFSSVEQNLRQDIRAVEKNLSEQISREANDVADLIRDVITGSGI